MRVLEPTQAARVHALAMAPVQIVKLTQFTNVGAGTIAAVHYLSKRALRYPYGGGPVVQAETLVRGIDPLSFSMADVPSPDARYASSLVQSVRLVLANRPYRGGAYLEEVLSAYPLEGAQVEIVELLCDPGADPRSRLDLDGYAGTEHTVWFSGRVARVEGVDLSLIQLRCETSLPVLRWDYATDPATVDPRDLGSRLPLAVGAAKTVRAVGYVVGWSTTLAAPLASTTGAGGAIVVTDATGLPASGAVRVDVEEISYSAVDYASGVLTISARGLNGTTQLEHTPGAIVGEVIAEAAWVLSALPSSGVSALYLRNPYNGERLRVPTALAAVNLADDTLVPGRTVTSLRLSAAALRGVLADAYQSAQVTQQPVFADAGNLAYQNAQTNDASGPVYPNLGFNVGSWYRNFSGGGASPTFTCESATPIYQANLAYLLRCNGTLPSLTAVNVELLFNVNYNTLGSGAGTYQMYLHLNGFPGFDEPYVVQTIPVNSQGSFAYSSGKRGLGGINPSAYNNHPFYVRPYVSGVVAKATTNFVGLSGITFRFGYIDANNIYREVDVEIEAASTGYALEWFADVEGPTVPAPPTVAGYAFDSDTGFNAEGCTVAAYAPLKVEGAASLALTAAEATLEDFESASGWNTLGGCAVSLEGTLKTEGSSSLFIDNLTTWTNDMQARGVWKGGVGPFDLSDSLVAFDIHVPKDAAHFTFGAFTGQFSYLQAYGLTPTTGFRLFLSSSSWASYTGWYFGLNAIPREDEWFTIIFDPSALPPATVTGGGVNLAAVTGFEIDFAPTQNGVATRYYVDRFRRIPKTMTAQHNGLGGIDLSASPAEYTVALMGTAQALLPTAELYFSDDVGTGTTPPASRRKLELVETDFGVPASFNVATVTAVDAGTPDVSAVETLGLKVTLTGAPTGALVDLVIVLVDDLRRRDDSTNPYVASVGALIERRVDVQRYLIEELCGEVVDDDNFTATDALIGGVFGVDLRELGETFEAIAVRLAYESRCNLVRALTNDGARFRLLASSATYAYGSPVRTLTELASVAFAGQDLAELRARFFAYYGVDATRDDLSSGGYRLLEGATPESSSPAKPTAAELEASEALYGERPADYIFLRATHDPATARDTLGYYAFVRSRARRVLLVTGVSWREAYDLEEGDVVEVQPRWRSAPITARVIDRTKNFRTQVFDLRVAEVPV